MKHAKKREPSVKPKAALFFGALAAIMVVSLIVPLRPTSSLREKRELTPFPEFSTQALWSGDYFRGIDDWFSDTFPGRDGFLELNKRVRELYGARGVEIHGQVEQGDDIPDAPYTGE